MFKKEEPKKAAPEKEPLNKAQNEMAESNDENAIDYRNLKSGDYELHVK